MSTILASLTSLPYTSFRKNRHFYLLYDGFFLVTGLVLAFVIHASGWRGLTATWNWQLLLLLPLACHLQILCSVWIHNATHNNFPRSINRLVGELCGVVVLTKFASWEIIHQRHHKYSDDHDDDPHPILPDQASYWKFLVRSVVGVEQQLQRMYYEMYGGKTPQNVRYQFYRAILSFSTSFVLLPYLWAMVLGLPAFTMLFLPSALIGFFHLMHFNWSTHNPWNAEADFRPVNLDSGFYKIGNRIWHGIYFHGNHHKKASLFNPMKMAADKALPVIKPGDSTAHYPRKKVKRRTVEQRENALAA